MSARRSKNYVRIKFFWSQNIARLAWNENGTNFDCWEEVANHQNSTFELSRSRVFLIFPEIFDASVDDLKLNFQFSSLADWDTWNWIKNLSLVSRAWTITSFELQQLDAIYLKSISRRRMRRMKSKREKVLISSRVDEFTNKQSQPRQKINFSLQATASVDGVNVIVMMLMRLVE